MNDLEKEYLVRLKKHFNKPILSKSDISEYCDVSLGTVTNMVEGTNGIKLKSVKFGQDKRSSRKIFIEDFAKYLASIEVQNETQ